MDETGQAGSLDEAGAYRGRGGYPDAHVNGATPSDDALEAIVSAWREPASGAIAGRASVNGTSPNGANINGTNINGTGANGTGVNGTATNGTGLTGGFSTGGFSTGGFSTGGFSTGSFSTGSFSTGGFGSGASGTGINGTGINGANGNGNSLNGNGITGSGINGNGVNGSGLNGSGLNGSGLDGSGLNGGGANGTGGPRGRAEVRSPYSDMLAPMSPPVSSPPPVQPPTSTLHYGHYGPDGQGWPSSTISGEQTGAIPSLPSAAANGTPVTPPPGTVYGALSVEHSGDVRRPVSAQPAYEQAPSQQPYDYDYEQPASALDRVAEQQPYEPPSYEQKSYEQKPYEQKSYEQKSYEPKPYEPQAYEPAQQYDHQAYESRAYEPVRDDQRDQWGYPEQRHRVQPALPEFDWAAPAQQPAPAQLQPAQHQPERHQPAQHQREEQAPPVPHQQAALPQSPQLPVQRVPEDDPLVGPLPPALLGSAGTLSPEPLMPTFADDMTPPAYDPPELPQRVPAEPDVPPVPAIEPQASPVGAPELARITNFLREEEDDAPESPDSRPDGFDIQGVLRAVQTVSGVREATLRRNPDGLHTLRLELLDDADAGQVSRIVARMLNDKMGLSAEPNPRTVEAPPLPPKPPSRNNAPHSALPGYGREARRRRPVSAAPRRPAEEKPPPLMPHAGVIVSPRVVIESVDVSTQGIDATVEVRLTADGQPAIGVASGPNFDGYILKLSALAAASAVDQLLIDVDATVRARCFIEHAAVVPMGGCEVGVVVLLLMYDGFVEQLTGSAVVAADSDSRQAVVRATMAAVNRRLEALLP